jgi:hypothetical protein
MHIQASVIEAPYLYQFAESAGIAYYNQIQHVIYRTDDAGHNRRHRQWFLDCFTVGIDDFDEYWQDDKIDWHPLVEQMVRLYMIEHEIETLVIVTSKCAHTNSKNSTAIPW